MRALASLSRLGVRVKRVGMKWNKGLYTVRERGTVFQNLVIAFAGPLVNLILIATAPLVFSLRSCKFLLHPCERAPDRRLRWVQDRLLLAPDPLRRSCDLGILNSRHAAH